jgi:hypothetical protein
MTDPNIERLLDERELERVPAASDEVADYWRKALRAYADSRLESLAPENAVLLAYQSGLSAATAAIRAAGRRVKSRNRHHYLSFYTLAILGTGTGVRGLAREMDELRDDRHTAGYSSSVDETQLRRKLAGMHELLGKLLPAVREWLLANRSDLGDLAQAP